MRGNEESKTGWNMIQGQLKKEKKKKTEEEEERTNAAGGGGGINFRIFTKNFLKNA